MNITLPPDVQQYVEDQVRAGRYESVGAVLEAAVAQFRQADAPGDFGTGELDDLIAQAEAEFARGEGHTLDEVRAHFAGRAAEAPK